MAPNPNGTNDAPRNRRRTVATLAALLLLLRPAAVASLRRPAAPVERRRAAAGPQPSRSGRRRRRGVPAGPGVGGGDREAAPPRGRGVISPPRGGGGGGGGGGPPAVAGGTPPRPARGRAALAAVLSVAAASVAARHRAGIAASLSVLLDRERFRSAIIGTLNAVASRGDAGLALYSLCFVLWEAAGMPTSVVETAAGMAFGFRRGLAGSYFGKTAGSLLAFGLGRTVLSSAAGQRVGGSEAFGLIERGVSRRPVSSAVIVRYSPFPQILKNLSMSLTRAVTLRIFAMTLVIHGLPFSVLWAALGDDSSRRIRASEIGETVPQNYWVKGAFIFTSVFGFTVSPAVTAWWLNSIRNEANNTKKGS